jgi:hypothetical protein
MLLMLLGANIELCNLCPPGGSADAGITTSRHYLRLEHTMAAVRYQSTARGVMVVPSADINTYHIAWIKKKFEFICAAGILNYSLEPVLEVAQISQS